MSGYTNNNLEKFRKIIPGKIYYPKDLENGVISPNGDFEELEGINAIIKNVYRILLTPQKSYVFDPEFGVGLHKYIFELNDDKTVDDLRSHIKTQLARYESRAVIKTNITPLSDKKGYKVDLLISYNGEKKNISLSMDESLLRTLD